VIAIRVARRPSSVSGVLVAGPRILQLDQLTEDPLSRPTPNVPLRIEIVQPNHVTSGIAFEPAGHVRRRSADAIS
jgi:hypothetical protein